MMRLFIYLLKKQIPERIEHLFKNCVINPDLKLFSPEDVIKFLHAFNYIPRDFIEERQKYLKKFPDAKIKCMETRIELEYTICGQSDGYRSELDFEVDLNRGVHLDQYAIDDEDKITIYRTISENPHRSFIKLKVSRIENNIANIQTAFNKTEKDFAERFEFLYTTFEPLYKIDSLDLSSRVIFCLNLGIFAFFGGWELLYQLYKLFIFLDTKYQLLIFLETKYQLLTLLGLKGIKLYVIPLTFKWYHPAFIFYTVIGWYPYFKIFEIIHETQYLVLRPEFRYEQLNILSEDSFYNKHTFETHPPLEKDYFLEEIIFKKFPQYNGFVNTLDDYTRYVVFPIYIKYTRYIGTTVQCCGIFPWLIAFNITLYAMFEVDPIIELYYWIAGYQEFGQFFNHVFAHTSDYWYRDMLTCFEVDQLRLGDTDCPVPTQKERLFGIKWAKPFLRAYVNNCLYGLPEGTIVEIDRSAYM
jgi:hypothetical protein